MDSGQKATESVECNGHEKSIFKCPIKYTTSSDNQCDLGKVDTHNNLLAVPFFPMKFYRILWLLHASTTVWQVAMKERFHGVSLVMFKFSSSNLIQNIFKGESCYSIHFNRSTFFEAQVNF